MSLLARPVTFSHPSYVIIGFCIQKNKISHLKFGTELEFESSLPWLYKAVKKNRATVQSFDDLGMLENERSKLQKLYLKIIQ